MTLDRILPCIHSHTHFEHYILHYVYELMCQRRSLKITRSQGSWQSVSRDALGSSKGDLAHRRLGAVPSLLDLMYSYFLDALMLRILIYKIMREEFESLVNNVWIENSRCDFVKSRGIKKFIKKLTIKMFLGNALTIIIYES